MVAAHSGKCFDASKSTIGYYPTRRSLRIALLNGRGANKPVCQIAGSPGRVGPGLLRSLLQHGVNAALGRAKHVGQELVAFPVQRERLLEVIAPHSCTTVDKANALKPRYPSAALPHFPKERANVAVWQRYSLADLEMIATSRPFTARQC